MPWLIVALVSWFLFLLSLRGNQIKQLWTVGLISFLVMLAINTIGVNLGLISFEGALHSFNGSPVLLLISAMPAGIIIVRFLPAYKWWQFLYILLFSILLVIIEFFLVENNFIIYQNWHISYSLLIRFLTIIAIVWLSNLTVKRRRGYLFK